jgi:hypothetical protein
VRLNHYLDIFLILDFYIFRDSTDTTNNAFNGKKKRKAQPLELSAKFAHPTGISFAVASRNASTFFSSFS